MAVIQFYRISITKIRRDEVGDFCIMQFDTDYCVDVKGDKMDNHDKSTRSYNMSRIRSKNTKPEETVRKYLFSKGFRYRKNDSRYPGRPDIVLPKYKTIIFVNGCFWHGHAGCKDFIMPKSNVKYWVSKINGNIERDCKNVCQLEKLGWNVITVWECQLKKELKEETLKKLTDSIKNHTPNSELSTNFD